MNRSEQVSSDWRTVYLSFRAKIDDGLLRPGDRLPTIAQLAADSRISKHSARRVFARLKQENHVESWRGVGHRVSEPRVRYQISDRTQFWSNMERSGRVASSKFLATRTVRLNSELADLMDLRTGARVLQVEMLRTVENRAVALSRHHFPVERFPGIDTCIADTRSISRSLEMHGVQSVRRRRTRIDTRAPTAHEVIMLGIPSNQSVMVTIGTNVDRAGSLVELTLSVWRGDCVSFEV